MMQSFCFTVVIPVYNRVDVVFRAIDSVLAQRYRDWELIIVDDGSTDGTSEVLLQYADSRIRVITQENRGRSAARNTGAQAAQGDYLLFLDSDDEADPHWLLEMHNAGANEAADLICCGARWLNSDRDYEQITLPRCLGRFYHNLEMQIRGGTFAIRRDHFQRLGGYVAGLEMAEHTDLALRFADAAHEGNWRIGNLLAPLITIHNCGGTFRNHNEQLPDVIESFIARHSQRFKDDPSKLSQYLNIAGVNAARTGDVRRAQRLFRLAVWTMPTDGKSVLRLLASLVPGMASLVWRPD